MTIGLYMSAMGLGAFASKYIKTHLFDWFVGSEILIGLIGGLSAISLFWFYANTDLYAYGFVLITVLIGMLVGVEIPLLIRILEDQENLRQNVAHALTYDYIGGLVGALAFPVLFLPQLGLLRTAAVLGLANLLAAGLNFTRHRHLLKAFPALLIGSFGIAALLIYTLIQSPQLQFALEQKLYRDQVIVSKQTPYQQLTVTQWHNDIRLFINGGLQFSSLDEYRYHESLVHVPLSQSPNPQHILVLGGGDGLAVREILKFPEVKQIELVDIDPEMTRLFTEEPLLSALNQHSLSNPKLRIHHQDAFSFVESDTGFYDVILVDLPDPSYTGLSKLYSKGFYELLKKRLSAQGILVTQSTSPFFAPQAFWCINKTLKSTGLNVYPYQVEIPSFGNWGFQLASHDELDPAHFRLKPGLKNQFLNPEVLQGLFVLPEDIERDTSKIEINTLMKPVILQYYNRGWNSIR